MSTTVKTGWLKDKQGNKFAPRTVSSQVITSDGITLEEYLNTELDQLEGTLAGKVDVEHTHEISDITELQNTIDLTLDEAKEYTDSVASGKADSSHNHDEAYDVKGAAEEALVSAKEYTNEKIAGLADEVHTHAIADVTSLQETLDGKANVAGVAYIDEDDNETVTLSVDLDELASLIGGDV